MLHCSPSNAGVSNATVFNLQPIYRKSLFNLRRELAVLINLLISESQMDSRLPLCEAASERRDLTEEALRISRKLLPAERRPAGLVRSGEQSKHFTWDARAIADSWAVSIAL